MALILATILFLATGSCVESYINTLSDFMNETFSSCPGMYDCKYQNEHGGYYNRHGKRHCDCDTGCARRSTCCYDAPAYDTQVINKNIGRYRYIFDTQMFFNCEEGWKDDEIKEMCNIAHPETFDKSKEPLLHLPVKSKKTQIVYTNFFCSVCNYDSEDIEELEYKLSCDDEGYSYDEKEFWHITLQRFLSDEGNWAKLVWAADDVNCTECRIDNYNDGNYWKIKVNDTSIKDSESPWSTRLGGVDHFKCHLSLSSLLDSTCGLEASFVPEVIEIEKCADSWNSNEVKDLCQSFKAPVEIDGITYRNVFCAICNHKFLDRLCPHIEISACAPGADPNPLLFLFDVPESKNNNSNLQRNDENCLSGPCSNGRNKFLCKGFCAKTK